MNPILKELTFYDLQILQSLGEEKSLRSIARLSGIEPTSLSKRIVRLEELFGFEIIKRSAKGFILTGEGEKLIESSININQEAIQAFCTKQPRSQFERVLTIGTRGFINILSATPMIEASKKFKESARLRFIDMSPDDLQKATFENVIDIGLHFENFNVTSSWSTIELGKITWQLFARKDHPLKLNSTLKDVLKYPFIGPGYWTSQKLVMGDDGFPVPWRNRIKGHEVQTAMTALKIIKATDQLVYLPTLLLQDALLQNELKIIQISDTQPLQKSVYFSSHLDRLTQKEHAIFIEHLKNLISSEVNYSTSSQATSTLNLKQKLEEITL